ncbi:MAG: hypothetical protein A2508_09550 [Candidatus Lambdaproteobacteria bacterium RIFOXYD12_FULL_49_8]|uniref:Uncharacterized protein n=1 Tax=Candidatus Lambdaproteobacteria bacterium RIFOXYD2_FULL_50_16 TaxID=1817772 RepID=A0A1F6GG63_9PROT|nr:MAG: hypothetical protein A2527_13140 [Candidatus Lambdaproteobacteria bacterium RIFOXYD2_FULL_50_16]OGG98376.1 MAG: hypothetical protein A2508_09550 [Candidatus Lambdaproteobacteria bacterium RIFOXYD12_FULL_49_8]
MINLTPLTEDHPRLILANKYNKLKNQTRPSGWEECHSEEEWLVKLHFLRRLFLDKRITPEKFQLMERALVLGWLSH